MEVTKHNLTEVLEKIRPLLKNADFISFDMEFSGLGRSLGKRNHDLDTAPERYEKAIIRVREYGLIQIGISIFRFCKSSEKYLSATYCFYLSGKTEGSYRYEPSSMNFLASNGFNFNKLFLDGLPFMSLVDEVKAREKREEKLKQELWSTGFNLVKIKEVKARHFFNEAMQRVKESRSTGTSTLFKGNTLGPLYRKILQNNVAQVFPTSLFRIVPDSDWDVKVTHFETDEDKQKYLQDLWEENLSQKLGFTHVVKLILESGKPLVGHNVILDLLHFVHKFVAPLPDTLHEFRILAAANLPLIYDTKLLAKDPPFSSDISNTALASLYESLLTGYSPPVFETESGFQSYSTQGVGQAHDGGFDAFMTGVCFATMLKKLEGRNWGKRDMMKSQHIKNYGNKVNFMGSYDIPFISVDKPDVAPDRSFIYSVTCPSNWSNMDVKRVFGVLKMYKTVWVDDTEVYVIPQEKADILKSGRLLSSIRSSCSSNANCRISMYKVPSAANNGVSSKAASKPSKLLPVKRSSKAEPLDPSQPQQVSGDPATDASSDDVCDASRILKRLKSVGSEKLSTMTLESPVAEVVDLIPASQPVQERVDGSTTGVRSTSDFFEVPDDW